MDHGATTHRTLRNISAPIGLAFVLSFIAAGCGRSGDGEEVAPEPSSSLLVTTLPATSSTAVTTQTTVPQQLTYVIQPGDSLSLIAQRFEVLTQDLADFNAISDPNSIKVGQELRIPPVTTAPPATDAADGTDSTEVTEAPPDPAVTQAGG